MDIAVGSYSDKFGDQPKDEMITIVTIQRMARRGTLEVEHLLRAAREGSSSLADELDAVATAMGWSLTSSYPEVPWARWTQAIGIYCREGHAGLIAAAVDPIVLPFVVGLLEELKSPEALQSLATIAISQRDRLLDDTVLASRVIAALNLAGGSAMELPIPERFAVRDFLHDALESVVTDQGRGVILCALRYFGDDTSLPIIAACPPLPPHWESARVAAVRGIRKAARQRRTQ